MSDITISYKGNDIATMDASGTKTLLTEGKYCEDDITLSYTKPSGGASIPRSDVNFYDYDGTIVAAYTAAEWTVSQTLPSNPTHIGLTAQGWNYTVAEINTEVTAQGQCDVGQMYVTHSGKNEIDICIDDAALLDPYIRFGVNGTAVINWGDGSAEDTVTGTRIDVQKSTQHTYQSVGKYTITISATSGTIGFYGVTSSTLLFNGSNIDRNTVYANMVKAVRVGSNTTLSDRAFNKCVGLEYVTIPSTVTTIGSSSFAYCYNLSHITIPNGISLIGLNAFDNCEGLASISIPKSVTTLNSAALKSMHSCKRIVLPSSVVSFNSSSIAACYSLQKITIPNGTTAIPAYLFESDWSLVSITIPSNVTSIGNGSFNKCYGLKKCHVKPTTPPTLASDSFNNTHTDLVIYVPYSEDHSVLNDYQTASNWLAYASKMQEEPQ